MDKLGSSVEYPVEEMKTNKICDVCKDKWKHDGGLMNKCEACKHLYCKKCPDHHKKFPTIKNQHPNNDVSENSYSAPKFVHEICSQHPEEIINMYCDNHKTLCCPVCVVEYHRDCTRIENIYNASKGILPSDDYESFLDCVERRRRELQETKHLVLSDIHRLACVKSDVARDIDAYTTELIKSIQELGRKSLRQIQERYTSLVESMNDVVVGIDKLLDDAEVQLKEFKKDTEPEMFYRILNNASTCDVEDSIYYKIESFQGLSFSINKKVEECIKDFPSLGEVNYPCKTRFNGDYSLRDETDHETCSITGMCLLSDDTVVMTDAFNGRLKRLDQDYNVIDSLALSGEPTDVCQTKKNEVAVMLLETKAVQFVAVADEHMILAESFDVGIPSRFLNIHNHELYLSCGGIKDKLPGHIRKYDLSGNLVGKFELDTSGMRMFSTPRHLAINAADGYICVADGDNGATVINMDGIKLGQFQNSFLSKSVGAATIGLTKNMVCGWGRHANVVQQFDEKIRLVGSILNSTHGIEMPTCIVFNQTKGQLIVSSYSSDKFHVFDLY